MGRPRGELPGFKGRGRAPDGGRGHPGEDAGRPRHQDRDANPREQDRAGKRHTSSSHAGARSEGKRLGRPRGELPGFKGRGRTPDGGRDHPGEDAGRPRHQDRGSNPREHDRVGKRHTSSPHAGARSDAKRFEGPRGPKSFEGRARPAYGGKFGADKFGAGKPRSRDGAKPRHQEGSVRARPDTRPAGPPHDAPVTPAPQPTTVMPTSVETVAVTADESGMRLDRFFEGRFPGLSFSHIQRIIRKGEVRVNGKRADPKDRIAAGQAIRIPPLKLDQPKPRVGAEDDDKTRAFLKSIILHEDDDVLVLNKPMGLAVQGGSGTVRHVDGMLEVLRGPGRDAQRPRLVHRLDKDTAGCLLVAKTRFAASALAKTFRSRSARKIYWAIVAGVPKPRQGRISTFLAKEEREDESIMRIAQHGDEGASHAITYYAVVETAGPTLSWISLKPVTGRTHQLRAHMAHIGHPIIGDPKYFSKENWQLPGGIQNRLHLLARRIVVPHPRGGTIDVTAPLPLHMQQSWNLLGFEADRYDPIVDAPEE